MKINYISNQSDIDSISQLIQPKFYDKYQYNLNEKIENIMQNIYADFNPQYGIEGVNISLLDESGSYMIPYKFYNPMIDKSILDKIFQMKIPLNKNGGIAAYAVQKKESVFVSEIQPDHIFSELGQEINALLTIKSNFFYPLISGESVLGILTFPAYSKAIHLNMKQLKEMNRTVEHFSIAIMACIANIKIGLLFKEMNHRIKNNFQIVSYFINLASFSFSDDKGKAVFKEAQSRITSFALLHEKLYKSDEWNKVGLKNHLEDMMQCLMTLFHNEDKKVVLNLQVDDIMLDANSVTYLSLIINELVTNIFKYAFVDRNEGLIEIKCQKDSDHHITLIVRDDGIGLPKDLGSKKQKTYGMNLLSDMVSSLRGQMDVIAAKGTLYTISFPITK